MKAPHSKKRPVVHPARSARKPRRKTPVTSAPRDKLFEALREELGL
jgi:hypothetical protein